MSNLAYDGEATLRYGLDDMQRYEVCTELVHGRGVSIKCKQFSFATGATQKSSIPIDAPQIPRFDTGHRRSISVANEKPRLLHDGMRWLA